MKHYRQLKWLALSLLGVITVLLAVRIVIHMSYEQAVNGAEQVVMSTGWQAAKGRSIYNTLEGPPYVFCVYNPLMPYLCGLTFRLFGPSAVWIRAVAVMCLLQPRRRRQ